MSTARERLLKSTLLSDHGRLIAEIIMCDKDVSLERLCNVLGSILMEIEELKTTCSHAND